MILNTILILILLSAFFLTATIVTSHRGGDIEQAKKDSKKISREFIEKHIEARKQS